MQSQTAPILFLFLFHVSSPRHLEFEKSTELEIAEKNIKPKSDISTLEDALVTLNELATAQKQLWHQQESRKDQIQANFTEINERDLERTRALEVEQNLLKEIRGKISRKLKFLVKNGNRPSGQCNCNDQSTTYFPPKDCASNYIDGFNTSGLYKVWPTWNQNGESFPVYCDMNTDGGGWTIIYRRENTDISEDYFKRNWAEYSNGFGDLTSSFWIGNQKLYQLTKQGSYELRFDFLNHENVNTWSVYRRFRVAEEDQKYATHIEEYVPSGTAGDIFMSSKATAFSTYDRINMERALEKTGLFSYEFKTHTNCAEKMKIGWWYPTNCIFHSILHLSQASPLKTEMKIRPAFFSLKKSA